MTHHPEPLSPGAGFTHREIVDPLSREPLICQLIIRLGETCFVRPLVVVAPWHTEPGEVAHEQVGHREYWNAWRMSAERLQAGLIATRDVRERTFAAKRVRLPRRVPHRPAHLKPGLRFLHRSLLVPYTWRPLLGQITQVRGGQVNFVGVVEVMRREYLVAPVAPQDRSGRWQLPEPAFREGLVAMVAGT